ncbi:MAG TPA: ATP-binding cassette domain-containing protein [Candidatus Methanoculleus thermohydrogenotrophicum]|jgi:iron complex transport system ATP-binding protein|nr:ATP-binding cassette domain-containing protein [Candidatus Methanoculleus thermohydrogenotrophicum]NLM81659.1 ATP-binding cassette domain-containing protein [Candidatus Methanoculleus thermohydrogenotrophicum]HOB18503.1 ATP-binding cassette domain-containing protein [Candidatus Methanoculleus thermohydrogenotrophicum]HPZ38579.1 ATP-binding cassette domain-containing protein [Candidatus Methanoculleus thermohydrogenotrophicum]HQC91807.1 ATP-binding cassette domain-containing protein [Candidat
MTDTNADAQKSPPPLLEFEKISVVRDGRRLLDSVSLTVQEGEHIAILGPNGAGKSSLVRTITREYYPSSPGPDVIFRFRGQDRWDAFDLRSHLGVVSGDLQHTFTRGISGREVVLSGFFSSIGLFNHEVTPEMEEKADEVLKFLEVDHLADRPMIRISSGEARRLLIGRALVHDPGTLLLDEPTTSLDLHALRTFRKTLRKIARSGTGIILVTHNLHDIIPEISRVILMRDGTIWRDGPKAEVLTDDTIGRLFRVPVHVMEEGGYYYATGY